MKRKRYTPPQVVRKLQEAQAALAAGQELAKEHGHELVPAGKPFGRLLGVPPADGLPEIAAGNK